MTSRKWGAAPLPEGVREYRYRPATKPATKPTELVDEPFDTSSATVVTGGERVESAPLNEDNLADWAARRPSDTPADPKAWAKAQEASRQRVEAERAKALSGETNADRIRREHNERDVRDLMDGRTVTHAERVERQTQLRLDLAAGAARADEAGPRPVHRAADGDLVLDKPVRWSAADDADELALRLSL